MKVSPDAHNSDMDSTSASLLHRVRNTDDADAWDRFVTLYAPLIYFWAKNRGLGEADRADLVQEVLAVLVNQLPGFQYNPDLRFRNWLQTITLNKATDLLRRNSTRHVESFDEKRDGVVLASDVDLFEERQYREFLLREAKKLVQPEFERNSWLAFTMQVDGGKSASEIAMELGISVNAVRVAKSRVLRRIREELQGLLD